MQASKKVPFEDPNVLNGVRALYVVSNLIIAGIYVYVQLQINKKRGMYNRRNKVCTGPRLINGRHDCAQVRRTSAHGID